MVNKMNDEGVVYWSLIRFKKWKLYIAATKKGLCYAGPQLAAFEELEKWVQKRLTGSVLLEDDKMLKPYKTELIDYLDGRLTDFSIQLDLHGTEFQLSVWRALQDIPYGKTVSYSDIAERIGRPSAVRAVGTAIGANPVLLTVPCHRVIGKNGALTGFRGGLEMKEQLLELEK